MPNNDGLLPDLREGGFFARHIATCARLSVTPVGFDRARDLLAEWTAAFNNAAEPRRKPD